jgi:hypothetical protein
MKYVASAHEVICEHRVRPSHLKSSARMDDAAAKGEADAAGTCWFSAKVSFMRE